MCCMHVHTTVDLSRQLSEGSTRRHSGKAWGARGASAAPPRMCGDAGHLRRQGCIGDLAAQAAAVHTGKRRGHWWSTGLHGAGVARRGDTSSTCDVGGSAAAVFCGESWMGVSYDLWTCMHARVCVCWGVC